MNSTRHALKAGCALLTISCATVAWGQDATPSAPAASANAPAATAPAPPPAAVDAPVPVAAGAAAQAVPASEGLHDIVVTATRRSESLQNVALNVAALSGDSLAKSGVTTLDNALYSIPNTSVNVAAGFTSFSIRGISSNTISANLDSPVAVQSDEVYISKGFMLDLLLFDTDRMEVLPGPQGTLFGRNSTGGTINVFSKRPTSKFEAGGTLQYGNYNTFRGEAYVSGPLTDQLSFRLSGFGVHQGTGYYHNTTIDQSEDYERKWAVRGQLQWDDGSTKILLSGHYGRDTSTLAPYEGVGVDTPESYAAFNPGGGTANVHLLTLCQAYLSGHVTATSPDCVRGEDGLTPGDNNPYTSANHTKHYVDNSSKGVFLRVEHDLGFATLTSLSAYEGFHRQNNEVGDGSPLYNGTEIHWASKINQFTQEVRLTSKTSGIWKYVLGAFYEHDSLDDDDYLTLGLNQTPATLGFRTKFHQTVDAASLFGSNTIAVTPTLSVVAGARFNYETTKINGGTCVGSGMERPDGDLAIGHPTSCPTEIVTSDLIVGGNRRTDTNASFKIGLEYRPQWDAFDQMLVYGNISTGFRSGGFSAALVSDQQSFQQLSPEQVTAYEVGFKSETDNRHLRINGDVFHYDFRNGILKTDDVNNPSIPIFVNAAQINTWGADLNLAWLPVRGLQLSAAGGWTDAHIKGNVTSGGVSLNNKIPVNSPKFSFTGAIDYSTPITDSLKISANFNANWRSSQFLDVTNKAVTRQPGYWLTNASIALARSDNRWELSVFARNLTKTVYKTYILDLAADGWLLNIYGDPRTYGVALKFKI
jgi:iron complex outermembrane recepter protein